MPEPSAFKPVTDAVKTAVGDITKQMSALGSDVGNKFKQTFTEEMDELYSWGEMIFGKVQQVIAPFASAIAQWFLQTSFAKNSSTYLRKLFRIEDRREKRDKMKQGLGKKSILAALLEGLGFGLFILGATLGAVIAPIVAKITEPFRIIGKLATKFTNSKPIQALFKFLRGESKIIKAIRTEIGYFVSWIKSIIKLIEPKALKGVKSSFKIMGKVFKSIIGIGEYILKSPFGKGFMWGFKKSLKWIFWPLQIITSTIEFIKGFASTEGDLFDKAIGGIKAIIKEFFGVPIRLLGDIIDWVASKFGIELDLGGMFENSFNTLTDYIFRLPIFIKDLIKMAFNKAWETGKSIIKSFNFGSIFDTVKEFLTKLKKGFFSFLRMMLDNPVVKAILGKNEIYKSVLGMLEDEAEQSKEEERAQREKEREKERKERQKRIDKMNAAANKGGNNTVQINTNESGGGAGRQVHDSTPSSRNVITALPGSG